MTRRITFDAPTRSALRDHARLLHMAQAVRSMNQTFKNGGARGLSAVDAKPAATTLLKRTYAAAAALTKEAFSRDRDFAGVRRRHLPGLHRALDAAIELARQERDAVPEVGARGVFRQEVELPLRTIIVAWSAPAEKTRIRIPLKTSAAVGD